VTVGDAVHSKMFETLQSEKRVVVGCCAKRQQEKLNIFFEISHQQHPAIGNI